MIEVQYRQTELDIARWQRLNQIDEQWRYYRLVVVSLLPSTVILLAIGSIYTGLWMAVAVCVMGSYTVLDYLHLIGLPPNGYQRSDRFDRTGGRFEISQTISEFKWQRFDGFRETRHNFQFGGLGRCAVVPKHGYAPEQWQQLRQLVGQIQKAPKEDALPVELFRETIEVESPFEVYRFGWTAADVAQLYQSPFVIWQNYEKPVEQNEPTVGQAVKTILYVVAFMLVTIAAMAVLAIAGSAISLLLNLILVVAPFLVLLAYQRMQDWIRPKFSFDLPTSDFCLRFTEKGIGIGNQDSFQLIGWNDLTCISTNNHLIGFTNVLNSTQFIPHRVIDECGGWDRFCSDLEQLRSKASPHVIRPSVEQLAPIETNNPYQSPMSQ